jgi:NADH:ubiquinone oxidoreductase subunit B-like Fe-S oxidoreductase
MKNLSLQIESNKRSENEDEWMLHTLLQFMGFSTRFFNKKIVKSDMCQKNSASISTSRFGHVQHNWIVHMDLVILTGKVIDKMIVDSGPFD